jgi:hypothetical protein
MARKWVGVVSSTEAFQTVVTLALQVKVPTTSVAANNPNPTVGEEC